MIVTEYSGQASIAFGPSGAEVSFSARATPVELLPLYVLNDLDQPAPLYCLGDDNELTQLVVKP
jgi:hypothetical protein